jgi:hypothetical protein
MEVKEIEVSITPSTTTLRLTMDQTCEAPGVWGGSHNPPPAIGTQPLRHYSAIGASNASLSSSRPTWCDRHPCRNETSTSYKYLGVVIAWRAHPEQLLFQLQMPMGRSCLLKRGVLKAALIFNRLLESSLIRCCHISISDVDCSSP